MNERIGLDEKVIKKCEVELKEPTSQIEAHLKSLRKWSKNVKHLQIPDNDDFLLRFLRCSKFNHITAQKRIDKYCTFRASPKGHPNWYIFSKLNTSLIDLVLETNIMVPLGTVNDGHLIILSQISQWDPEIIQFDTMMQVLVACIDLIAMKQSSQIYGVSVIIDMENTKKVQDKNSIIKNWSRLFENIYPIRLKNVVFYRDPLIFDVMESLRSLKSKQKLRERTFRIKNRLEDFDRIPGLFEVLPYQYGGSNGPLDKLCENWRTEVKDEYVKLSDLYASIHVDEAKRPSKKKITRSKKEADLNVTEKLPSQGQFTKLDKY